MSKLIITCAIKGSKKQKKDNPFIPITSEEMAESSMAAAKTESSAIQIYGGIQRPKQAIINPPDFLEFLANNAEEAEVRIELESLHARMVRLSRELDREVATSDKAREIMALIAAMRGG